MNIRIGFSHAAPSARPPEVGFFRLLNVTFATSIEKCGCRFTADMGSPTCDHDYTTHRRFPGRIQNVVL